MLADLCIVICKPDQRIAERHKQHHQNEWIVQTGPEQGCRCQCTDDQQTAHRWRARFGEMRFGTVAADRLAFALFAAQNVDQWRTKDEPEQQRRQKRAARTEGDIAKQVKDVAAI